MTETCARCGGPFTDQEWDERHANHQGRDVHVHCCDLCEEDPDVVFVNSMQPVARRGCEVCGQPGPNWCARCEPEPVGPMVDPDELLREQELTP